MGNFNQKEFNEFILDNNIIKFSENPIIFVSGRDSHVYFNWRNITNNVFLLDKLSDYILDFTRDLKLNPDCFYGVPEGATKIGIITQFKFVKESKNYMGKNPILPMGRGKIKEHGNPKDRYFVGVPKGKTIIIEDVVTVGTSLLPKIDELINNSIEKLAVFVLTDRMELRDDGKSVKQVVESRGISYYSLSNALDLLPLACKKLNPSLDILKNIEDEFKKYGVRKLKLY